MDIEEAIKDRRTHKAFAPEPVPDALLDELLDLARWAPNHHLTNPPAQDEEDLCATACAAYAVLLGAHGRGLAGYWRTPGILRTEPGLAALGIPAGQRFVGLLHLGFGRQDREPPARAPLAEVAIRLA